MIATDDGHPLQSRSIHKNAANCKMIRFCYQREGGGDEGYSTAHVHLITCNPLPVASYPGPFTCAVRAGREIRPGTNHSRMHIILHGFLVK